MKRLLYILPILIFFSACQKEVAPRPERNDFAEVEEPVIEHVNIPLKDEQISKLFAAAELISSDTRSNIYQNVNIQELLPREGLVVIMFGAPWSGPSVVYFDIFMDYAKACEHTDVAFAYYNIDANPNIAVEFGIRTIPTTIFIKNNMQVANTVGILHIATLDELVEQYR